MLYICKPFHIPYKMKKIIAGIFFMQLAIIPLYSAAQNQEKNPTLFVNCQRTKCYYEYLVSELSSFPFTREMSDADIQILILTDQNPAGRTYYLYLEGQKEYFGKSDTITFNVKVDATDDIVRNRILNGISHGLIKFLNPTQIVEMAKVNFVKPKNKKSTPTKDKWNNWIFGVAGSGRFEGESNRTAVRFDGNFRGGRTTEHSKFSFFTYYNQRTNSVVVDSVLNVVKVNDYGLNSLYVKSFSDHWALGGFIKGFHSVYQNIQFSKSLAPALEYSVFPVKEFNRRQFRWIYQAGMRDMDYIETTVFDKIEELLPYQQITGILGLTQPWGNFRTEITGYQYLNMLDKYRVSLEIELSLRIAEGLSLSFYGNGSQINNQITLPKSSSDASSVLLGGRQLATNFSYLTSFGLSYTFGSMNNSIVNPRFSGIN